MPDSTEKKEKNKGTYVRHQPTGYNFLSFFFSFTSHSITFCEMEREVHFVRGDSVPSDADAPPQSERKKAQKSEGKEKKRIFFLFSSYFSVSR